MKKVVLALLASALLATSAWAATASGLTKPIHQFIYAFNSGNIAAGDVVYASGDILIIDDFSQHRWYGPHAPQEWAAAFAKAAKDGGYSDTIVKVGTPTATDITGDSAYVVVPANFHFKLKGQPMSETARMAFVLRREGGEWKITSWIWVGTTPKPVAAKPASAAATK